MDRLDKRIIDYLKQMKQYQVISTTQGKTYRHVGENGDISKLDEDIRKRRKTEITLTAHAAQEREKRERQQEQNKNKMKRKKEIGKKEYLRHKESVMKMITRRIG